MLYSRQLLNRYISPTIDLDTLSQELTLKTCEVEENHERVIPDQVVIGKVLSAEKHPDADKLTVCQVDCGSKGTYQICTGAENIRPDIFVPVALPGCFLPAINLQIDPRTMRGLESNGMICSKEELGIGEDLDLHGIRIMQDASGTTLGNRMHDGDFDDLSDKLLGKPLKEYAPWLENQILEVENKTITHRPDLFGHFGLAWEINALFQDKIQFTRLHDLRQQLTMQSLFQAMSHIATPHDIPEIQSELVGAYHTIHIDQIVIKESPLRLRLQLLDLGIQPRNNRVDFSNYFMYLTGQPIHCFDADKVTGNIIVRQAKDQESFTDLFDTTYKLSPHDILISDVAGPLALAGVIGGKESGVTSQTKRIIIEIAQFDPTATRKTALRIGTRTEAATRFEKHINPLATLGAVLLCMDELAFLGHYVLGERSLQGISTRLHPRVEQQSIKRIDLDIPHITTILGDAIDPAHISALLSSLGCSVDETQSSVTIPVRRSPDDINHTADLTEEIARIVGYNQISPSTYSCAIEAIPFSIRTSLLRNVETLLADRFQMNQIETYPWIHERRHQLFSVSPMHNMEMDNELSPELHFLRHTMVPSLLEAVEKNAPFFDGLRLFDTGQIRKKQEKREYDVVAFALVSNKTGHRKDNPFIEAKSISRALLASVGLENLTVSPSSYTRAHTKQQCTLSYEGTLLCTISTIHPQILAQIGMSEEQQVVIAEFLLNNLLQYIHEEPIQTSYHTIQDQLITRELSFVIPKEKDFDGLMDAIQQVKGVSEIKPIDFYTGAPLPPEEKSITITFTITGDGSLTTEQINATMKEAIHAGESTGAKLRG